MTLPPATLGQFAQLSTASTRETDIKEGYFIGETSENPVEESATKDALSTARHKSVSKEHG